MEHNENARLVGKSSSLPWILFGIALLVIAILAIAYYAKDKVDVQVDTNAVKQDVNNATDAVKGLTESTVNNAKEILNTTDAGSLQGRKVDFTEITVKSVGENDMVFWVNDSGATDPSQMQGRDVLVHMNEQLQAQVRALNGGSTIKDGTKLSVKGTIKLLPSAEELQSAWMLNADDASYAKNKVVYIEADSIELK